MKKYQIIAISRSYYSIQVEANSKDEALILIENMKKPNFKLERVDPIELLENSIQQINDNQDDKI